MKAKALDVAALHVMVKCVVLQQLLQISGVTNFVTIELQMQYYTFFSFHSRWLMTPFRDNGHWTRRQRQFNTALSATRQKVERSFSLLKGRWRKLQYLDHLDLVMAVQMITAACILHNYCLLHDDFGEGYFLPDVGGDGDDGEEQQGPPDHGPGQKRVHLINIVAAQEKSSLQVFLVCFDSSRNACINWACHSSANR